MPNVYSRIYLQLVFAVKNRQALIESVWKDELCRYAASIIQGKGHKSIITNAVKDHIHLFLGYNPSNPIPDLVREIKCNSSKFINDHHLSRCKFEWQTGYGAFSYSRSDIDRVYQYIQNQEQHHKIKTFKAEYLELLEEHEIAYDEKYLFDWI